MTPNGRHKVVERTEQGDPNHGVLIEGTETAATRSSANASSAANRRNFGQNAGRTCAFSRAWRASDPPRPYQDAAYTNLEHIRRGVASSITQPFAGAEA
jgi:hypothetical protein